MFKDCERWDSLNQIDVKTLTIGAADEIMSPEDLQTMAAMVANGKYLHRPDGSPLAIWDDQAVHFGGLLRFPRSQ